jgi:hypothetical protein
MARWAVLAALLAGHFCQAQGMPLAIKPGFRM